MVDLSKIVGFDWDDGNIKKNWDKHDVDKFECEQIFFNDPLIISNDVKHSQNEPRFLALGKTDLSRRLFISFTIRDKKIRVISARDMTPRERKYYGG